MEFIKMPLPNHYVLVSHLGFSVFMISDSSMEEIEISIFCTPMRLCISQLLVDSENKKSTAAYDAFMERLRFLFIKYLGLPALQGKTLRHIIKDYEKTLDTLMLSLQPLNQKELIEMIQQLQPAFKNKPLKINSSPNAFYLND